MDTISALSDDAQSHTDRLIADLAATLLRVDADEAAPAIDEALRRAGEQLDVDRCTLLECAVAGAPVDAAFHWVREGAAAADPEEDVPAIAALVDDWRVEGDALVLERIPGDLPVHVLGAIPEDALRRMTMTSAVVIRVVVPAGGGTLTCALVAGVVADHRCFSDAYVERLRILAASAAAALARRRQQRALAQSRVEIAQLRARVDGTSTAAAPARSAIEGFDDIVGNSPALRRALMLLQEVAATDSTVLLLGETGTGKELFAKALHARSARRRFSIVSVNCAALPPTLIESELFGHERGAFTDAITQRQGRFELAHQGTLFLDEIGDLPLELQAKLLRVLQEGEFERLGASRTRKVDVRVVAATHRDLKRAVGAGDFREDLYYRLNVFPIRLPPLRERREDIPALVWATIDRRQHALRRSVTRVPQAVMEALQRHEWPGNIRQLENVVERALIHSTGDTLVLASDDIDDAAAESEDQTALSSIERAHIEKVLRECAWRINGAGNAAERLGLHPNTLRFRMQKLGIVRGQPAAAPPPRQIAPRTS